MLGVLGLYVVWKTDVISKITSSGQSPAPTPSASTGPPTAGPAPGESSVNPPNTGLATFDPSLVGGPYATYLTPPSQLPQYQVIMLGNVANQPGMGVPTTA